MLSNFCGKVLVRVVAFYLLDLKICGSFCFCSSITVMLQAVNARQAAHQLHHPLHPEQGSNSHAQTLPFAPVFEPPLFYRKLLSFSHVALSNSFMFASNSAVSLTSRYLTFSGREEIALECARRTGIRATGRRLSGSPGPVSRVPGQKRLHRRATGQRFGPVAPAGVGGIGQRHLFRIACVPRVLGHADFLNSIFIAERGHRLSGHGITRCYIQGICPTFLPSRGRPWGFLRG